MQRQYILVRKLRWKIEEMAQQVLAIDDVNTTSSLSRRIDDSQYDIITIKLHQWQSEIVSMSCACCGRDGTNSWPACGSLYRDNNNTYAFWPCSLLIVRCPLYCQYSIYGPTIHFRCIFIIIKRLGFWWMIWHDSAGSLFWRNQVPSV